LPLIFDVAQTLDDVVIDETVVEVVLWLIDDQGWTVLRQQDEKYTGVLLANADMQQVSIAGIIAPP
jgi:hypothetical protein